MTKPEELANQIRSLCAQIDSKIILLREMGYDASVGPEYSNQKLILTATKTIETSL